MQIFVRSLTGQSLAFDVDAADPTGLAKLHDDVALRTGVPVDAQRLSYGGRPLADTAVLSSGCHIELTARLRGGEKKKRCAFLVGPTERCSSPALNMIGDCSSCQSKFCGRHRLPEDHRCPKLSEFKKNAFELNREKLTQEAASAGSNLHNVA